MGNEGGTMATDSMGPGSPVENETPKGTQTAAAAGADTAEKPADATCAVPGHEKAAIDVPTPGAGERVTIDAQPGAALRLSCGLEGVKGSDVGNDLELIYPNGGVAVIHDFRQWAAVEGATLTDCSCGKMSLEDLVARLGLSPEAILPAAGGASGAGAANHPTFAPGAEPEILGGYPYPDILAPTELAYGTPAPTPTLGFLPVETSNLPPEIPNGPLEALDDVAVVEEAALPPGSDPSSPAERTTGNLLANDKGGPGITIASIDGHTPDAGGHIIVTTGSGTLDVDAGTGAFTYTLEHAGTATSDVFDYVATDSSGSTATAALTVDIVNDAPQPKDDDVSTPATAPQDINLIIVFDRSGSMAENPGVPGYSTRLELARAAVAALFEAYQSIAADLHIKVVDFSTGAAHSAWLSSPEAANAYLAQLQADGGTHYDTAIAQLIDNYNTAADPAPPADLTQAYFLSDGVPNPATTSLHSPSASVSVADWEGFLTANHIDNAFAVGIGASVAVNDPNLGDVAFPNGADGAEPNRFIVTDEGKLLDTLVGTTASPVSGNVLTNDIFGADDKGNGGVGLVAIQVDGHTYSYDQAANEIRNETNALVAMGALLTVDTALGGQLEFQFDTGDYSYTPLHVSAPETEAFQYTIVDSDGDPANATLQITVTDGGVAVVTPQVDVGTDSSDTLDDSALTVDDIMSGGLGADTLTGGGGNDHVQGGTGNDLLIGGAGSDILLGGQTNADKVAGGNDTLDGGAGSDQLFGGDGDDTIFVGTGDKADGGTGNDSFVLQDNSGFNHIAGGANPQNDLAGASNRGDVVAFDGTLDLSTAAHGKIAGIESLSMKDSEGGGSQAHDTLTLTATDLLDLGAGRFDPTGNSPSLGTLPSKPTVRIDGDGPDDTVNLGGKGWSEVAGSHGAPPGYALYAHDDGSGHANSYALVQATLTVHTA